MQLFGIISDSSGQPVDWELQIADLKKSGNGKNVAYVWDGKKANGKVIEVGSHTATLHGERVDKPDCGDTETLNYTVDPVPNSCSLKVTFGSSANVAGGELTDSLPLFSLPGSGPGLGVTLHYASLDAFAGALGLGWSHTFESRLRINEFGEAIVRLGDGTYKLYTPDGSGGFVARPGDYATLAQNGDGSFTRTRKDGTREAYAASGELLGITDRNGNAVTLSYLGGRLQTVSDGAGRSIAFAYDGNGHLAAIIDPAGEVYTLAVGETLDEVAFPDAATWRYSYAANAFLTGKLDPVGHLTTYTYDDQQRVVASVDPEGRTRSIAYPQGDETVRTTTFTEKDGGLWQYTYDTTAGDLLAKTDPEGNVTSYSYDAQHNQLTRTDASGTVTSTYDAAGNMTSSTDVAGQTTTYTYNPFGQVTSITDAAGGVTSYAYDERGNLTRTTDPSGATTSYAYDGAGRTTSVTAPDGGVTRMSYDAAGNLAGVTDPSGATVRMEFDAAGRLIKQIDAQGGITTFGYDTRGNLIQTVDPLGNVTTTTYDANGHKTGSTDANGNLTRFETNAQGQVVKSIDALGQITSYAYGGSGCPSCGGGVDKLTTLTDASGQTTTFAYDPLGRLTSEIDPLGHATTHAYDAKGQMVAKTDANGNTIRYSYDALGRLVKKSYPDGSQESFAYDARGNLLSAANADAGYTFTYDAAGRATSVTDAAGRVLQYVYDAAGRKTKMIAPDGKVLRYEYDTAGRLSEIRNGGNYVFVYDTLGRRSSLTFPNGVVTSHNYDSAGRLTNLTHKNAAGTIVASNGYTHDKTGNRLTNTTPERTLSYAYDAVYQLTEARSSAPGYSNNSKGKGGGIPNATEQQKEFYVYDPVGNRLRTDKVTVYEHNAGNAMLRADNTDFRYDNNGNLIEKTTGEGTTTYVWDYENRLVMVALSSGATVTFKYDPFGRRIEKATSENGAITVTRYVYDNEDILYETDETGKIGNRYIHGPGIDEPLALIQGKETYYYHADGLGSIIALTDKAGKVVQDYQYDSFGNLKDLKTRIKQPYTYTGREFDRETGLYYYRARYRNPVGGSFISKDPIGFAGGDVNLYRMVLNRPIQLTDPFGLTPPFTDNREEYSRQSTHPNQWGGKGPFGPICGSGPSATWIPDGGFTMGGPYASYTDACEFHDKCYGTCGANKATCDLALLLMTRSPLYYLAVTIAGGDAYDAAQKESCNKCKQNNN